MATPVLVPISEYLNTTYRPDRDYLQGEVRERNKGERPHATVQGFFVASFFNQRKLWRVLVLPEQRIQTSLTHYRVADVCVLNASDANDPIVRHPPLLCIEIVCRDQKLADMTERVQDYLTMGVENIWVFDPQRREAWVGTRDDSSHLPKQCSRLSAPPFASQLRISLLNLKIWKPAASNL